jgi:hypothetical protein
MAVVARQYGDPVDEQQPPYALVNDKTAAETSSQAIRDVVHAVPSDAPLEES